MPAFDLSISRSARGALARAAAALAAAWLLLGPAAAGAQTVPIGGTGAGLGVVRMLADAYRKQAPAFQVDLVPNLGSGGGIKALGAGSIQAAIVSRPLTADERSAGLRGTEIGQTAFVLATTKDSVRNLSLGELAELLSGRQKRWLDGQPVRLVLRPPSDIDTALLAGFSPAVGEALAAAMSREGMLTAMTDQDSADAIERLPGGIGASSLSLLASEHRRAHPIAIDGVAPTVGNVASGAYRYKKPLILVTRGAPLPPLEGFLAFVGSPEGRRVLAASGVHPAPVTLAHR